ncbi:hypothetical protein EJ02DRAFT_453111 [Clathrospora elynae]|uniref:Diphthamide biosynthesis protein 4 n=1 Tax=Clathrospora elynae TaxID=706981 RepID=A0A6A5SSK5_9PLEO|nr:hypothetical protein EJ02DRAFT_453111 [Clathrospora elynae]
MAYTKDYYHILGMGAPNCDWQPSAADLRRAYKIALLAAHPDKKSVSAAGKAQTVDDVKEAYTVLANAQSRLEYDDWLLNQDIARGVCGTGTIPMKDFVLGLEVLDLGDFVVREQASYEEGSTPTGSEEERTDGDGGEKMEWTRGCRCGADEGFRIREEELESAEMRGEKEVLVGCEGCSLWVRVAFDVEEG